MQAQGLWIEQLSWHSTTNIIERGIVLRSRQKLLTLIDDVNPSRSLLCETEQRTLMRSKNDCSRGASKRRSPPTAHAIVLLRRNTSAAFLSLLLSFEIIPSN